MSENLTFIIEWAKQIQLAAQLEHDKPKGECLCRLIDVEDIITKLLQITEVIREELKEKENMISNLHMDQAKKLNEIIWLTNTNQKLDTQNKKLQALITSADNVKKLEPKQTNMEAFHDNQLFTKQLIDIQVIQTRKQASPLSQQLSQSVIKKYLWLNENITNRQNTNESRQVMQSQHQYFGSKSGQKDEFSVQKTLFHSKSSERFSLSQRDIVRNLMDVGKNETNLKYQRQEQLKKKDQKENNLQK